MHYLRRRHSPSYCSRHQATRFGARNATPAKGGNYADGGLFPPLSEGRARVPRSLCVCLHFPRAREAVSDARKDLLTFHSRRATGGGRRPINWRRRRRVVMLLMQVGMSSAPQRRVEACATSRRRVFLCVNQQALN